MKAYSLDLRQRVIQSRESVRKTAARYQVSTNFIVRLRQQYRATGQWTPKPRGGNRPRCIDAAGEVWLQATLEQEPSLTLAALCTRYEAAHQVRVSKSSMDRTLTRLRISYKKNTGRSPAPH
jgi:transposase